MIQTPLLFRFAPQGERQRGTVEKFADELSGSRHFKVALYPMESHA
jgi:hypothetical protein